MDRLGHNQTVRITCDSYDGIYRVVLDLPLDGATLVVKISEAQKPVGQRSGRKKLAETKSPRKKAPQPNVGTLIRLADIDYAELTRANRIEPVEIERQHFKLSTADELIFQERKEVMRYFLDFDTLSTSIIGEGGISGLVKMTAEKTGASRALIYKLWSLLCRHGFSAESLRPRRRICGAPGVSRPCDPGGRKKAGRKTDKQRVARASGSEDVLAQPGMSSNWRTLVVLADKRIPSPKPPFPERYQAILDSQFVTRYRDDGGALIPLEPTQYSYPNQGQVRSVLKNETSKLQHLLEMTTKGHFERSHRGMQARNWEGVAGPGHTWAIDSTIGDIYLRSSVNRAWIIGRPIVYIIVDVWSTAIVGFYVCLTGPSWDTAKVSLFCAAASPQLVGQLWQYEPILSLNPAPTLPVNLMCDRGEYLSRAANMTATNLILNMSYAPPYRPDLKGLVEVLHRIKKDKQYFWVPGAIDARRKEYELRRFDPNEAKLTVPEYVEFLHIIFSNYNLTADRRHRLDTYMRGEGVMPFPAGLWRWGHEVGIGTRRINLQSDLIRELLPKQSAVVSRMGVRFCGSHYGSSTVTAEQWTAYARNFGSWSIDVNHFPGTMSRIWTPEVSKPGLMELQISEQSIAAGSQTVDEVLDAVMYSNLSLDDVEHARVAQSLKSKQRADALIAAATSATDEAVQRNKGAIPTITESRAMEHQPNLNQNDGMSENVEPGNDEAVADYIASMKRAFSAANAVGQED